MPQKKKTAAKKKPRKKSSTPPPSYLSKLDPALALGAARAAQERRFTKKQLAKLATASYAESKAESIQNMSFGIHSLASHMPAATARQFIADDRVPVLIDSSDAAKVTKAIKKWRGTALSVTATTVCARVPRRRLRDLAESPQVKYVEASTKLRLHCDLAHASSGLVVNNSRTVAQTGQGVLVGVIDTGIDVDHPAFKANGATRIVNYLDQEQDQEFDATQIDAGAAAGSVDTVGHGTHVAGIAAGNGAGSPNSRWRGVAPEADLAIVKSTLGTADLVAAVQHIFTVADQRGQPCVVNMSLGGHVGGHDGSTLTERTIDQLSGPGRIVVVSAGNEGDDPIHASTVLVRDAPQPDRWVADFRLNARIFDTAQGPVQAGLLFVQIWTQREDQLSIRLRSPDAQFFSAPQNGQNQVDQGSFFIEASHQIHGYSGDHVTSFLLITDALPQWLGGWSLIVEDDRAAGGVQVGAVHAWIRGVDEGNFTSGVAPSHLVGMPGTSFSAVTVASYATRNEWDSRQPNAPGGKFRLPALNPEDISFFSSIGPTRDGQGKPEIAAPGQWLLAPLSKDALLTEIPERLRVANRDYAALQGTSMSAPYVTGALALLLEKNGGIDWAEAKRRLIKSARQDLHSETCWNPRWGYGKLDVERLLTIEPD